ncbi:MAG: mitofilin family membrane protein [Alphaproteobacteria bacterium]
MAKRRSNGETEQQAAKPAPERAARGKAGAASTGGAAAKPAPRRDAPRPGGRRARGVGGTVTAVVIVALIAAVGYLAWPRVKPRLDAYLQPVAAPAPAPDAPAPAPDIAGLETRVAALEAAPDQPTTPAPAPAADLVAWIDGLAEKVAALNQRVGALEARLERTPAPDLTPLAARLDGVEARLAAAAADDGAAAAVAALAERVDALTAAVEGRVAALEAQAAASQAARPAMLLAVGQLRAALRGSGPYRAELATLATVAGDDAGIASVLAALEARADGGVPTPGLLRARFAAVAGAVVGAAIVADEGTWVDHTVARLARLVTVRRVGDVAGDAPDAVVARAEARLAAGDFAAAVAEVERLAGASAEAAAAWLADARARLAAERTLAALDARVLAALATVNGGG